MLAEGQRILTWKEYEEATVEITKRNRDGWRSDQGLIANMRAK